MKETKALDDARARMAPGAITASGFLGGDGRPLADIIQADEESFLRLGMGFDEAVRALEDLKAEGALGLGEPRTAGSVVVSVGDARGLLPCPWDDGVFHKNSVHAEFDGLSIVYSDLSLHMLSRHHFCQGRDSPFRLDPLSLKALLDAIGRT